MRSTGAVLGKGMKAEMCGLVGGWCERANSHPGLLYTEDLPARKVKVRGVRLGAAKWPWVHSWFGSGLCGGGACEWPHGVWGVQTGQ